MQCDDDDDVDENAEKNNNHKFDAALSSALGCIVNARAHSDVCRFL